MSTKKILIIKGGGRPNGNTAQLIDSFAKGAEEVGHNIEIISLMKKAVWVAMSVGTENLAFRRIHLMSWFRKSKLLTVLYLPPLCTFGLSPQE